MITKTRGWVRNVISWDAINYRSTPEHLTPDFYWENWEIVNAASPLIRDRNLIMGAFR